VLSTKNGEKNTIFVVLTADVMKNRSEGAELFHADGRAGGLAEERTDITKIIVTFRNIAKEP
jgi:hypothetical protein